MVAATCLALAALAGAAGALAEEAVVPDTAFKETPANPTKDTTPSFAYGENPTQEVPATFRCSFQGAPFSDCPAAGIGYGPLPDGVHDFAVYAQNEAGADPTPATWTWEIDTVPPDTTIDAVPPEPSSGFAATFSFHSSEPHPTFRCRLDEGAKQVCSPGRTYFLLEDGRHRFEVWASDQATNEDPSPATHTFAVDTRIGDRTPPNTKIVLAPADPSEDPGPAFTYASTELGSSFQCRLDDRPFGACPSSSISFPPKKNGRHVFRVRAVDRAGNVDEVPDSHAWTIAAPLPRTLLTRVPAGISYLRRGERRAAVAFGFRSNVRGASFRCRVDRRPFRRCTSPHRLSAGPGRHLFELFARDRVGNLDPSPERWIFRVKRPGGKGLLR